MLALAADIGFVLADGSSPTALMHHGAALLRELVHQLPVTFTLAAPVIAMQARAALGDHIAAQGQYRTVWYLAANAPV